MFRSLMAIIRVLYLYLAKVMFILFIYVMYLCNDVILPRVLT